MRIEINCKMDRTGSKNAPKYGKKPAFIGYEKEIERREPFKELLIEPL